MKTKALFYLSLASVCFGINPVVVKYLLNSGVNMFDIILAEALLLVFMLTPYVAIKRNRIKGISKENWKNILIITFISTVIGGVGFTYAQQFTLAVNVAFLIKLQIVFVPIISFLLIGEKHPNWKYFIICFSLLGTFLLATSGKLVIPKSGDIMIIGIAIAMSYSNVLTKKVSNNIDAFLIGALRIFLGSSALLILIFFLGTNFTSLFVNYLPYILLISGSFAIMVFSLFKGIELSTSSEAVSFFVLSAPISFLLSYYFLGEILNPIQILGGIIILISCYLIAK